MNPAVLVFEDEQVARLHPVTTARPAYAVSCGSFRLIDWLAELNAPLGSAVRTYLHAIERADFPELAAGDEARWKLAVNARVIPSLRNYQTLRRLLRSDRPGVVRQGDAIAAIVVPPQHAEMAPPASIEMTPYYFSRLGVERLPDLPEAELSLFEQPHDVIRANMEILLDNLGHRLSLGGYHEVQDGVFVAEGAKLGLYVACDASDGPILIDRGARVGPHCYLSGPAYIGPKSRLIEHAAIKDACSIGHTVKIGGEVEASVIEPYTNKQHYGFLGHSYLGSWINLGAGTCNSDLKNTYGPINMEYQGQKVASDMQFLGCLMGDYSKTAINTGIFTGKSIGVCSMLYGFITANVPSFVNYAKLFGQVSELPAEVMVATQKRMFDRRQVAQRPCDMQLIRDMYELTHDERRLAGEQLSL